MNLQNKQLRSKYRKRKGNYAQNFHTMLLFQLVWSKCENLTRKQDELTK